MQRCKGPVAVRRWHERELREVAEHAGVSVRTVSNVVYGFPLVAAETRERVQASIDELRYRPNAAARHLRRGRSGLIALVDPGDRLAVFRRAGRVHRRRPAEARGLDAAGRADRRRRGAGTRTAHGVRGQAVDGLVMSPWALSPAELRRRTGQRPAGAARRAGRRRPARPRRDRQRRRGPGGTAHLIGAGRRRIAAIGLQPHLANGDRGAPAGGLPAGAGRGRPADDPALEIAVRTPAPRRRAPRPREPARRRHRRTRCSASATNSRSARCTSRSSAGCAVPEDLAVAGFDDIEDGRYANPSLTTMAPDKAAIARAALDLSGRPAWPAPAPAPGPPHRGAPHADRPGQQLSALTLTPCQSGS